MRFGSSMGQKRNSRSTAWRARRQPKRLFRLEGSVSLPPPTRRPGAAGACSLGLCFVEWYLWQSPDDAGIAGRRPGGRSPRTARLMATTACGLGRSGGSSGPRTAITPGRSRRTCSIRTLPQPRPTRSGVPTFPSLDPRRLADLAVVIDLFARRVVGWARERMHGDLALAALRKALTMRRPAAGLIHHSDRGSQNARSIIRPSSTSTASCFRCRARGIATTTPWRRSSRP